MIARIHDLPTADLRPLLQESEEEGFRFLRRLQQEWAPGANRFDRAGEAFFGYYIDARLVAVGGLNQESAVCGRLRRCYVLRSFRRRGIGRALVSHIVSHAAQFFDEIVLHTDSPSADAFYRAMGFFRLPGSPNPTHRLELSVAKDQDKA